MESIKKELIDGIWIITLFLILFFQVMIVLGFGHIIELRIFNGVIMFMGIFYSLKNLKEDTTYDFTYTKSLFAAFTIGIGASLLFALYVTLYIFVLDPSFYEQIIATTTLGEHITPLKVPLVIFIEGTISSYIFAFITVHFLKKSSNKNKSSNKSII